MDKNYKFIASCDKDCLINTDRKFGKGGVAILWHVNHDNFITRLPLDDDRILGIQVQLSPDNLLHVFQVYSPCSNYSIVVYREYIDKLYNVYYMYSQHGMVMFLGDVNSKVVSNVSLSNRDTFFSQFLTDIIYVAADKL